MFEYNSSAVLWGGNTNDNNLYIASPTTGMWQILKTSGTTPTPRQHFPILLLNNYLYIFPGYLYNMTTILSDCYRIDLNLLQWESILCPGVSKVYYAYAALNSMLFLFGGVSDAIKSNELISLTPGKTTTLSVLSPYLQYPSPRFGHTLMRSRNYLWLFGGQNGNT
jgi:hypothetical protein